MEDAADTNADKTEEQELAVTATENIRKEDKQEEDKQEEDKQEREEQQRKLQIRTERRQGHQIDQNGSRYAVPTRWRIAGAGELMLIRKLRP